MLREDLSAFIVRGTVSSLMKIVNTIIAKAGKPTTELIDTNMFSSKCQNEFQIIPKNSKRLSPYSGTFSEPDRIRPCSRGYNA
jgi:hypothetical protein